MERLSEFPIRIIFNQLCHWDRMNVSLVCVSLYNLFTRIYPNAMMVLQAECQKYSIDFTMCQEFLTHPGNFLAGPALFEILTRKTTPYLHFWVIWTTLFTNQIYSPTTSIQVSLTRYNRENTNCFGKYCGKNRVSSPSDLFDNNGQKYTHQTLIRPVSQSKLFQELLNFDFDLNLVITDGHRFYRQFPETYRKRVRKMNLNFLIFESGKLVPFDSFHSLTTFEAKYLRMVQDYDFLLYSLSKYQRRKISIETYPPVPSSFKSFDDIWLETIQNYGLILFSDYFKVHDRKFYSSSLFPNCRGHFFIKRINTGSVGLEKWERNNRFELNNLNRYPKILKIYPRQEEWILRKYDIRIPRNLPPSKIISMENAVCRFDTKLIRRFLT